MDVLVLQHIACEPPGVFEDVLLDRGGLLRRVDLDECEALPASLDPHAAFPNVLGGGIDCTQCKSAYAQDGLSNSEALAGAR